jgi:endonuclease YncB( thermonuclease family)
LPLTLVFTTLGAASTNHGLPHIFANLAAGDSAVVREIVDGGRQVYLVGIQAPKLPLGRANFEKWPLADEAKKAPTKLVLERRVTLGYGGQRQDRYGRELAHLFTDEGLWVLGILLELGFARVYSFTDNRSLALRMLKADRLARGAAMASGATPIMRFSIPRPLPNIPASFR